MYIYLLVLFSLEVSRGSCLFGFGPRCAINILFISDKLLKGIFRGAKKKSFERCLGG